MKNEETKKKKMITKQGINIMHIISNSIRPVTLEIALT